MRWASFRDSDRERVGLIVGERVHSLEPAARLLDLLGDDGDGLNEAGDRATASPSDVFDLADVQLLPPIPRPPSVRDFYAFEQHVKTARQRRGLEMDPDWYELPVFYFSNPAALIGDGADVPIPPGTKELDFELEVAAI